MTQDRRPMVRGLTVDSPTSRDLDDAIWVTRKDDGWLVKVCISDVAATVDKGGRWDREAFASAFTLYFAAGNKPMLPRKLADERLSLLYQQLRKTITFEIQLSTELEVVDLKIFRSRLKSCARMTHERVDRLLDAPDEAKHRWWVNCYELAQGLLRKRREMGALVVYDLAKGLLLDEEGEVVKVPDGKFYRAYLIVQELMILVNSAVTQHLLDHGVELLLRNHTTRKENVRDTYLAQLAEMLLEPSPEVLEKLNGEARHLLNRARYGPQNEGHFALNLPSYAHWTSPIRRYADLVNHRILHAWLDHADAPYSTEELMEIAKHLNERSDEERDKSGDSYRRRAVNKLTNASKERLVSLPAGEFSLFVERIVDETIPLTQLREEAVLERLFTGSLEIADITRILFAQCRSDSWAELKKGALRWLESNRQQVLNILNLGHEICHLPLLDLIEKSSVKKGPDHMPEFDVHMSHRIGDEIYTSDTFTAAKVRDAEQPAAFSLICKIAGVSIDTSVTGDSEMEISNTANPKGQLMDLAQKLKIAPPIFDFAAGGPPHEREFVCTAQITIGDKAYASEPCSAASKKEAQRRASTDLLERLPEEVAVVDAEDDSTASGSKNPISALQEWTQSKRTSQPVYSYTSSGESHSMLFTCTCVVKQMGRKRQWNAPGTTKKEAKTFAAELACKEIGIKY